MKEQAAMMNQQQQHHHLMNTNPNVASMNQINHFQRQQSQPQMLPNNLSYGMWGSAQPLPQFKNPNPNIGALKPAPSAFNKSSIPLGPRSNWKGKRITKPNDQRRTDTHKSLMLGSWSGGPVGGVSDGNVNFSKYNLSTLKELQYQNRLKTKKFFPKKKFNKNNNLNMNAGFNNNNNSRSAPFAPRNTTSFLIRAKKSGGIAPLVSPCPLTPAVLPTPVFSPSPEVLVDMAKEEWGVDGYGSMKGLIRLRSPEHEMEVHEDDDVGSSESDVEEHVEVERRLDHDLSRFEMIYNPNSVNVGGTEYHNVLENRVDDQDAHIAQLEDENMILKERLFLMERELGDVTRRLQCLERRNRVDDNEEVMENESNDENESHEYVNSMEGNNEEFGDENANGDGCLKGKDADNSEKADFEEISGNDQIIDAECKLDDSVSADDEKVENDNIIDTDWNVTKDSDELGQNENNENIILGEERLKNEEGLDRFVDAEVKAGDN